MATPDYPTLDYPRIRRAARWFDVRQRRPGMWAYTLNRITGIGLVIYLYLHLAVLSLLAGGPGSWDVFVALVLLLGLHFIANHFLVKGGLRDFADVVAYLRTPIILVLEVLFLVIVTTHAMLGMRAILTDFGPSARTEKWLSRALTVLGVVTAGYGLWLTWVIIR
ncbi:MAG: hypothetical protein IMW89_16310 [Ktedonobacteraceae bacterium]|nr:hypothetical protein [Ktedonobacteraceae bacterium]